MTPTIGRVVHYKTDGGDVVPGVVAQVITDTELMLFVMDPKDGASFKNAVLEDGLSGGGRRWDWMPYQKLQPAQNDVVATDTSDDAPTTKKKAK